MSKTRNEAIAEKMGWGYRGGYFVIGKKYYTMTNKYFSIYIAKLLQSLMVEDGWSITIHAYRNGTFGIRGVLPHSLNTKSEMLSYELDGFMDEDVAIVELFCKVYGIA